MRSLIFSLKACLLLSLLSCQADYDWYQRDFSAEEKITYAKSLSNGVGYYYQGTVPEQFHIKEAMKLDTSNGDYWRELGTSRVKRGLAAEMQYYYGKAAELKPEPWAGFRGYLYLYFYRDYLRAIADFNLTDSVTKSVGYSQGQNHDYMRGIAYYGLKNYPQALHSLSLHIDSTVAKEGEEWVDAFAVLYRALTYEKLGDDIKMKAELERTLRIYPTLADAYFHLARLAFRKNDNAEAQKLIKEAERNYKDGYFHNRPYVEVLEQIYAEDINSLSASIEQNLLKLKDEPLKMFPD
tara:strand:+ start:124443 stop:125327 length:885 start_codon:yes stop_codon:yes gene_type:complete